MSTAEKKLIARIQRVKHQLNELGPMRPGSITRQYRKPEERKQPFYQISYTHKMKIDVRCSTFDLESKPDNFTVTGYTPVPTSTSPLSTLALP
ncbi:MAG: hypothetical protein WD490_05035 [Opitutales bacterium]